MTIFQTGSNQKKLTDYAARLRHNPPAAERKFRHAFREGLPDIAIRHQVVISPYIVDFLLPDHKIIIELDGDTHDPEKDKKRDRALKRKGFSVIRFSNTEIYTNMEGCLCQIFKETKPSQ